MKVYVVKSNDNVDSVFSTEARAIVYVNKHKDEDNPSHDGIYRHVYWRYHEYTVDEKEVEIKA